MTSIILTCFNNSRFNAHMSMACIANITKFTDPEDYELIVMNPVPKFPIRDDYNVLKVDKYFNLPNDPGYTVCMNLGAQVARGEYLVFIQNDVFVHEGWLPGLRQYIEQGYDAVFPDQVPRSREYVKATYNRDSFDQESMRGGRDAGLMMITKKHFEEIGRWNENLSLLAEQDLYKRLGKWTDTNKTIITHIMAGTNLQLLDNDPEEYDRKMEEDAQRTN